jgi:hypothetical protein
MVKWEQHHDLTCESENFPISGPQNFEYDGFGGNMATRPLFAGVVVAEDSSVRPGWHSKSRRLVLACSASFQALQPSHAESKETSHKMGRGSRGKRHGRNAQAMGANGESFHGYAHRRWVDSPTGRVGVMMRLRRSLEREHRLDV